MYLKARFYKTALILSLGFFLISICLGLFLRLSQVWTISGFNFKNFLHGHSHITLLGWVFNAFYIAIVRYILPEEKRTKGYGHLFWITQLAIFASLISFPIEGYSILSIVFSTLFILCSYVFCYWVLVDLKGEKAVYFKFIRWGIYYLVLSSIGPWSLGAIMNLGLKETIWYPLSIYFYLHFFYNGFFIFSIFGLLLKELKSVQIDWPGKKASNIFLWMNLACAPSFLLSVLWIEPSKWVYIVAFLAALAQLWACILLFSLMRPYLSHFKQALHTIGRFLFKIAISAYILKVLLQLLSAIPLVASLIYSIKSYLVIGYIHLVMIGVISCFLLGYFCFKHLFIRSGLSRLGITLFAFGFIASECLLFGQGTLQMFHFGMIDQFYNYLFIFSAIMPLGILLFSIEQWRHNTNLNTK